MAAAISRETEGWILQRVMSVHSPRAKLAIKLREEDGVFTGGFWPLNLRGTWLSLDVQLCPSRTAAGWETTRAS